MMISAKHVASHRTQRHITSRHGQQSLFAKSLFSITKSSPKSLRRCSRYFEVQTDRGLVDSRHLHVTFDLHVLLADVTFTETNDCFNRRQHGQYLLSLSIAHVTSRRIMDSSHTSASPGSHFRDVMVFGQMRQILIEISHFLPVRFQHLCLCFLDLSLDHSLFVSLLGRRSSVFFFSRRRQNISLRCLRHLLFP